MANALLKVTDHSSFRATDNDKPPSLSKVPISFDVLAIIFSYVSVDHWSQGNTLSLVCRQWQEGVMLLREDMMTELMRILRLVSSSSNVSEGVSSGEVLNQQGARCYTFQDIEAERDRVVAGNLQSAVVSRLQDSRNHNTAHISASVYHMGLVLLTRFSTSRPRTGVGLFCYHMCHLDQSIPDTWRAYGSPGTPSYGVQPLLCYTGQVFRAYGLCQEGRLWHDTARRISRAVLLDESCCPTCCNAVVRDGGWLDAALRDKADEVLWKYYRLRSTRDEETPERKAKIRTTFKARAQTGAAIKEEIGAVLQYFCFFEDYEVAVALVSRWINHSFLMILCFDVLREKITGEDDRKQVIRLLAQALATISPSNPSAMVTQFIREVIKDRKPCVNVGMISEDAAADFVVEVLTLLPDEWMQEKALQQDLVSVLFSDKMGQSRQVVFYDRMTTHFRWSPERVWGGLALTVPELLPLLARRWQGENRIDANGALTIMTAILSSSSYNRISLQALAETLTPIGKEDPVAFTELRQVYIDYVNRLIRGSMIKEMPPPLEAFFPCRTVTGALLALEELWACCAGEPEVKGALLAPYLFGVVNNFSKSLGDNTNIKFLSTRYLEMCRQRQPSNLQLPPLPDPDVVHDFLCKVDEVVPGWRAGAQGVDAELRKAIQKWLGVTGSSFNPFDELEIWVRLTLLTVPHEQWKEKIGGKIFPSQPVVLEDIERALFILSAFPEYYRMPTLSCLKKFPLKNPFDDVYQALQIQIGDSWLMLSPEAKKSLSVAGFQRACTMALSGNVPPLGAILIFPFGEAYAHILDEAIQKHPPDNKGILVNHLLTVGSKLQESEVLAHLKVVILRVVASCTTSKEAEEVVHSLARYPGGWTLIGRSRVDIWLAARAGEVRQAVMMATLPLIESVTQEITELLARTPPEQQPVAVADINYAAGFRSRGDRQAVVKTILNSTTDASSLVSPLLTGVQPQWREELIGDMRTEACQQPPHQKRSLLKVLWEGISFSQHFLLKIRVGMSWLGAVIQSFFTRTSTP